MALPQHYTVEEGGDVWIDLTSRPTTVTLTIEKPDGTDVVTDESATVSTINTTLSSAASKGDTQLAVASATGISYGSVFWLQDDPEAVLVQKVDGTDVYLRRPLLKDHVSGATAEGTRCTYTVSSGDADSVFWDGRIKWTVDDVTEWTEVECTKYPLRRRASIQDVFDRQPKLYEILDTEVDAERLLDVAHEELLVAIGAKRRARVFPGSMAFIKATALASLMVYYEHVSSDAGTLLYERYTKLFHEEVERIIGIVKADTDQDDTIEASDQQAFTSVTVRRA